jgi:hypothetical protein
MQLRMNKKKKGPKEDEAVRGRVVGAEGDTARDGYHAKAIRSGSL